MWKLAQCRTFGDYHDLYLWTDVALLSDVFENFRTMALTDYKLDPAHYISTPGLSWDAAMKSTRTSLELLTDIDMHLFVEAGIRGGVSYVARRYARANNPYIPSSYDPMQDTSYIMYWDKNNLYGWSMVQALPVGEFEWMPDADVQTLDLNRYPDDGPTGLILEVDLEYPSKLHDLHNDFPLAAEHLVIKRDRLSPYNVNVLDKLGLGYSKSRKLSTNLQPKTKYAVHYRLLKFYLDHGMVLKRIHRVLKFKQSKWLKSYVEMNAEKRKTATSEFEKAFYKLLNNCIFGKTIENKRNRTNIVLATSRRKAELDWADPKSKSFQIIDEELVVFAKKLNKIFLNKPIAVGFSVLELSKLAMYQFHYDYAMVKYGHERCKLLLTDTDSFVYHVHTEDIYKDMLSDADLFDTSDYPKSHFLHSDANKKMLGKMKDETNGIPILEVVGLKSKMYSILLSDQSNKITCKGIKKSEAITHQRYKDALFKQELMRCEGNFIRSEAHKLRTVTIRKIGMTPFDDKRWICDDGIETLAYGHRRCVM